MSASDSVPSLDQIGFLLGRAYYSYIGLLQRRLETAGLAEFVKPGMGSLLFALFREDNRTSSAIAAELQIAKSTMAGMVARMRDAGLIDAAADGRDGRVLRLRLTPLAKSLQPRCFRVADEMETELGEQLSRHEREQFRRSLALVTQTISAHLESCADERPPAPSTQPQPRVKRKKVRS